MLPTHRDNQTLKTNYYDDVRLTKTIESRVSIPSKYVKNGFLELFLPYIPIKHDEPLIDFCPNLRYYPSSFSENESNIPILKLDADSTLSCFANLYKISIDDSLQMVTKYRFHYHPQRKEQGLVTILDVEQISRGEHTIQIESKYLYENNIFRKKENREPVRTETYEFPFWKE